MWDYADDNTPMKFLRRIPMFSAVILLCLGLFACSRNDSIVGIWEVTVNAGTKTIEFNDDGVYIVTTDDGAVEEYGTYEANGNILIFTSAYKIDEGTRLNLQEDSEDIMTFSIRGKILNLTTKSGDTMELTRKK